MKVISVSFIIILSIISISYGRDIRKRELFNDNWKFYKGRIKNAEGIDFNDSYWRRLDLPHDWAIEGPFDKKYNRDNGALPYYGEGWYRKKFTIQEKYKDKKVVIEFDGAMANSKVWINGHYLGKRPYGYIYFFYDITPYLKYGKENVIAVQLKPEKASSRWYPGAGIYRNVWLTIRNRIAVAEWGTFITTTEIKKDYAKVNIKIKIENDTDKSARVILRTVILDT